jgi:hypothetical protein
VLNVITERVTSTMEPVLVDVLVAIQEINVQKVILQYCSHEINVVFSVTTNDYLHVDLSNT